MRTHHEQAAAQAGYPLTLFGYTPNDKEYWLEPGLPSVSACANTPGYVDPATGLKPAWHIVEFETDVMAPRFPSGMSVAVAEVRQREPMEPGIYIWKTPRVPDALFVGRLSKPATERATALFLTQDNGQNIICLLEWESEGFALYRVTHYNSMPVQ